MRLVCLGFGYSASFFARHCLKQGVEVIGTTRQTQKQAPEGITLIAPEMVHDYLPQADVVLISVPPGEGHDWALALCQNTRFHHLKWLGYLSSTGVYGDHQGEWVDEDTPPRPFDERSIARFDAERDWLSLGLPVHSFRLAGIYGPQRNILRRLQAGAARRIIKQSHVFSRIHVEDIAQTLWASLQQPSPGAIYNLADDLPAPSHELVEYAAQLLKIEPPPAENYNESRVSPMMRSFYAANRRIKNQKIKDELGTELAYPTYKEGLLALLKE